VIADQLRDLCFNAIHRDRRLAAARTVDNKKLSYRRETARQIRMSFY